MGRAVVKGVGYELVSCWAVGLLRNKDNPFAATSLDGWLIVKENDSMDEDYTPRDDVFEYGADSDYETDLEIYSDVDETLSDISPMNDSDESLLTPNKSKHTKKSRPTRACQVDALTLSANEDYTLSWGLEIKSPSSKKVITSKVIPAKNLHGTFSTCEFGDVAFHQLVFDNAYKMQLVHHAAVCNLDSVLFVVASETGVRYATLVHVPFAKRSLYMLILKCVYSRTLRVFHVEAWNSDDPMTQMPDFRPEVVSSSRYPITKESLCYNFIVWKLLIEMVEKAEGRLPAGEKIVPSIIAMWNRCKGRIDETTRKLDDMNFPMSKASPKQVLILREIKKLSIQVYLAKKNCFLNTKLPWGSGYKRIQAALGHSGISLRDILHQLATSYEMLNPIHGFTPGSPSRAIGYRAPCMNESTSEDSDGNYKEFKSSDAGGSRQLLSWKKEAKCYTRDVLQCSRNPYKKFIKDPTLDRIRKDNRLEHFPQSVPKKSSSSKKSSKGNKAIPKKKKTDHKESTHCAICVGLLGSSKAKKTVYFCPTCGVYLCNRRRGKSKSTCFKKWHTCTHLGSLTNKNTAMTPAPRTSPRRKKATGSVVTEDGKRRSTRGKK